MSSKFAVRTATHSNVPWCIAPEKPPGPRTALYPTSLRAHVVFDKNPPMGPLPRCSYYFPDVPIDLTGHGFASQTHLPYRIDLYFFFDVTATHCRAVAQIWIWPINYAILSGANMLTPRANPFEHDWTEWLDNAPHFQTGSIKAWE